MENENAARLPRTAYVSFLVIPNGHFGETEPENASASIYTYYRLSDTVVSGITVSYRTYKGVHASVVTPQSKKN